MIWCCHKGKYRKAAEGRLTEAKAKKIPLFGKYYIGMPVVDYMIFASDDNLTWNKDFDFDKYRLDDYFLEEDIKPETWRTDWTIKMLQFCKTDRRNLLGIDADQTIGLGQCMRKHLGKPNGELIKAVYDKDDGNIKYDDAEHGLRIALNFKSGRLYINKL